MIRMALPALLFASCTLCLLFSSPATAQSPPAPILPPSPAPAPAPGPNYVNLTYLFQYAGPFHVFLNYLEQTQVIETFQNQANNTKQGITIFTPKDSAFAALKPSDLANLTNDQLKTLLLYHACPQYYSLSDFKTVTNPISTFAGGQYTVNVTDKNGDIRVLSSWSKPKLTSSVYSTYPVAFYEISKVLLPNKVFSTDPPLVPAPAPAPESGSTSDLAPSKAGTTSSPKSSDSSTGGSSHAATIGLVNLLVLALSSGLMLIL